MMHKPKPPYDIVCVIFAGGKSSRMGQDKSLLPFGDCETLAEYQYERLSKLFKKVYISTKEEKFGFDAPLIYDIDHRALYAPTAGFQALFKTLDEARVFVISVDTPFITAQEIEALLNADRETLDAVIARTPSGQHPLCGIYHHSLLPTFEKMLQEQNHRLGQLLKEADTEYVLFEDEAPFTNLNHPEEYQQALSRSRG